MKKATRIIYGLLLIVFGSLLCLKNLNVITFDIFFDGWWTLFIIIPSLVSLFDSHFNEGFIGLVIGVLLLLACQDIITFDVIWKLFVPVLLIYIGLMLLFKSSFSKRHKDFIPSENAKDYIAVFAGQKYKAGKKLDDTNCVTVFGGIDLDLREVKIDKDIKISCVNIFGGTDLYVPNDVNIVVSSTDCFGGCQNKTKDCSGKHTIYIEAVNIFGGLDIK